MNQLALGWHSPYTMKPIDNKISESPKTIDKKAQLQQKHEHNNSESQANNFTTVPYLALNNHYVLAMVTISQYELIGWRWTKK
jgi:glutaredoxin